VKNILCFGLLIAFSAAAHAGPRGRDNEFTKAVFNDEGDTVIVYSTTCVSTSWNVLASSDSIRRSLLMQTLPANTAGVCISTGPSTSEVTCTDSTPGIQFSTAVASGQAYTDYSRIKWHCRSRAGTQRVVGASFRDSGDFGAIDK